MHRMATSIRYPSRVAQSWPRRLSKISRGIAPVLVKTRSCFAATVVERPKYFDTAWGPAAWHMGAQGWSWTHQCRGADRELLQTRTPRYPANYRVFAALVIRLVQDGQQVGHLSGGYATCWSIAARAIGTMPPDLPACRLKERSQSHVARNSAGPIVPLPGVANQRPPLSAQVTCGGVPPAAQGG